MPGRTRDGMVGVVICVGLLAAAGCRKAGPRRAPAPVTKPAADPSAAPANGRVDATPPPAPAEPVGDARVIFVSPRGEDAAPGTESAPLKTIRAAVRASKPGEAIAVMAGTYGETVELPRSGEAGKPICLRARGAVVIRPDGKGGGPAHGIVGRGVGHWVIEGFEITGHQQGIKFKDGHDITVRNCNVHDGASGLALEGKIATNITFEGIEVARHAGGGTDVSNPVAMENVTYRECVSHHNDCKEGADGFGISHHCTTRNVIFENCVSHHNGSDGFDISGRKGYGVTLRSCVAHHNGTKMWGCNFKVWNPGSRIVNCVAYVTGDSADANFQAIGAGTLVAHCTSGRNADAGIVVAGDDVRVVNCIIAHAKKKAVYVKPSVKAAPEILHCLVYECGSPGAVPVGEEGNIPGDPQFVDASGGDYRIARESAAAGAGAPPADVSKDAAGKARPAGARSIGAYEP